MSEQASSRTAASRAQTDDAELRLPALANRARLRKWLALLGAVAVLALVLGYTVVAGTRARELSYAVRVATNELDERAPAVALPGIRAAAASVDVANAESELARAEARQSAQQSSTRPGPYRYAERREMPAASADFWHTTGAG